MKAALPWLRQSPAPRVINIGSVYARMPDFRFFSTTVNRAAGLNLTKALAQELAGDGILVNAVNIGCVETPQWANIHAKRAPEKSAEEFFADLASDEIPPRPFRQADRGLGDRDLPRQRPGELHHGCKHRRRRRHGPLRLTPEGDNND